MSIRNCVIGAAALGLGLAALVNSAQANVNQAGPNIKCNAENKVVIKQPMPNNTIVYFTGTVRSGTHLIDRIDTEVVVYDDRGVDISRVWVTLPENVLSGVIPYLAAEIFYDEKGCPIMYAAR